MLASESLVRPRRHTVDRRQTQHVNSTCTLPRTRFRLHNNALCDPSDPSSTSDPNDPTNCATMAPFLVQWAIFPAEMRADAETEAARGLFGMSFVEDNEQKAWAFCEVDVEFDVVVPASLRRRRLSVGGSASRCG